MSHDTGQKTIQHARNLWERIDVLVNNAGMFKLVPIKDQMPDALHKMYATNAIGPILLIQEKLPELKQADGTIINVTVFMHTKQAFRSARMQFRRRR